MGYSPYQLVQDFFPSTVLYALYKAYETFCIWIAAGSQSATRRFFGCYVCVVWFDLENWHVLQLSWETGHLARHCDGDRNLQSSRYQAVRYRHFSNKFRIAMTHSIVKYGIFNYMYHKKISHSYRYLYISYIWFVWVMKVRSGSGIIANHALFLPALNLQFGTNPGPTDGPTDGPGCEWLEASSSFFCFLGIFEALHFVNP